MTSIMGGDDLSSLHLLSGLIPNVQ